MNSKQAKEVPIESYLASGGIMPKRTSYNTLWYHSPIRKGDSTPSFKVTIDKNLWWDYGLDKGGNIIDLVIEQYQTSVSDALRIISKNHMGGRSFPELEFVRQEAKSKDRNQINILEVSAISDPRLIHYITKERGIDLQIAQKYLSQAKYENAGRVFTSLAFANDQGGYELRSKVFKGGTSPKTISTLKGAGSDQIAIFEGFIDFLSFLTDHQLQDFQATAIIMNSIAFREQTIQAIQTGGYKKCYCFLDNDLEGVTCQADIENSVSKVEILNKSSIYAGFKDYNAYFLAK